VPRESLDQLVARYLEGGDEEAADEIVRRTRRRLLWVARRIGSPQDAEDAVHTAYLSLLHKRDGGLDAPVLPWLLTAVVRIAYRHKARERRLAELSRRLSHPGHGPGPAAAAAQREQFARLRAGVDRLPAKYRDVVVLHYLQGLTTTETAALLGLTPAAVKKRLQRARALLLGTLAPWLALPLLALPWLVADAVRGTGSFAVSTAGGTMQAKTAATLIFATIAAGSAGFGAAVATGTSAERRPARLDSAGSREDTRESVALLDEVARLEERARMLEAENLALREQSAPASAPDRPPARVIAQEGESLQVRPGKETGSVRLEVGAYDFRREALRLAASAPDDSVLVAWRKALEAQLTVEELKRAGDVRRACGDADAVAKELREQLQRVAASSPEAATARTELGHLLRDARRYRESDEEYERVRAASSPNAEAYAEATFQLAWNRRFAKDPTAAERLFEDASRLPGARDGIAAISRYNIAQLREEAGRREEARAEYEAVVREYEQSESGTVRYYVELARKRLKTIE